MPVLSTRLLTVRLGWHNWCKQIEATSMEFPGFSFLHGYRSGSHFLDVHESGHSPS